MEEGAGQMFLGTFFLTESNHFFFFSGFTVVFLFSCSSRDEQKI